MQEIEQEFGKPEDIRNRDAKWAEVRVRSSVTNGAGMVQINTVLVQINTTGQRQSRQKQTQAPEGPLCQGTIVFNCLFVLLLFVNSGRAQKRVKSNPLKW